MRMRFTAAMAAGLLAVTLSVAAAQGGGPVVRLPVVAVMPFDDAVISGNWGWTHHSRRWSPGAGVADLIASELVAEAEAWRSFRVVERDRLFEVLAEQDLGRDGRVDPATAARVGRILGADLLLMGAVTRFDVRTDHVSLPRTVGFDAERHHATVAFDGRLVDTTTAEIIARGRGTGNETSYGASLRRGELAGLDFGSSHFANSILGRAARQAARSMAREIAAELDRTIGPAGEWLAQADALVVYCETRGEQWWPTINRGARDGVREGDLLVIRRKRQDIFDPLTGELLKTIWDELGTMTVRSVEEKVASGPLAPAPHSPGQPQAGDVAILRGDGRGPAR
ncbi:MAG: CsgG/HfaB family protein [Armatimonadota bacterium]|jgi:curli biogenesis system outer membrane secretion channel CsgG